MKINMSNETKSKIAGAVYTGMCIGYGFVLGKIVGMVGGRKEGYQRACKEVNDKLDTYFSGVKTGMSTNSEDIIKDVGKMRFELTENKKGE